jgi:hypothetical protein
MTSGPTGLKIDWKIKASSQPRYASLSAVRRRCRVETTVPCEEQKSCCSNDTDGPRTIIPPAGVIDPALACGVPNACLFREHTLDLPI